MKGRVAAQEGGHQMYHQFIQPGYLDGSHHTGVAHTMQVSFLSTVDTYSPWGGTEEGHAVRGSCTVTTRWIEA